MTTTNQDSEHAADCACIIDAGVYSVCGRCTEVTELPNADDDGYDPFAEIERLEEEAEARA